MLLFHEREVYTCVYINLFCSHLGLECGDIKNYIQLLVLYIHQHDMVCDFACLSTEVRFRISIGCLNFMHAIVHFEKKPMHYFLPYLAR